MPLKLLALLPPSLPQPVTTPHSPTAAAANPKQRSNLSMSTRLLVHASAHAL
jgi:hypothetical protein